MKIIMMMMMIIIIIYLYPTTSRQDPLYQYL